MRRSELRVGVRYVSCSMPGWRDRPTDWVCVEVLTLDQIG